MAGPDGQISRLGHYEGYSEPTHDSCRRYSEYLTMRDGCRIAIDYFRPMANGALHERPLPVIWTHTRYQRATLLDGKLSTMLDQVPFLPTVVAHGYVVAAVDLRGAGASFGTKFGWLPPEEARDAYEVTEWLAAQPWSNGNVGMYGRSYLGISQYFCASENPPHLRAVFPEVAWLDEYGFAGPGGILLDWPVYSWATEVRSADRAAPLPLGWRDIVEAGRERTTEVLEDPARTTYGRGRRGSGRAGGACRRRSRRRHAGTGDGGAPRQCG